MKKFTLISMLSMFLFFSISVNAAVALNWVDDEGVLGFGATGAQTTHTTTVGASSIGGTAQFDSTFVNPDNAGFTHDWFFEVDKDARIGGAVISFLNAQYVGLQVRLDGVLQNLVHSSFFSAVWSIDKDVDQGKHVLQIYADDLIGVLLPGDDVFLANPQYLIQLGGNASSSSVTSTPIPAAIWLFGSALLGLGSLSTRRKSL